MTVFEAKNTPHTTITAAKHHQLYAWWEILMHKLVQERGLAFSLLQFLHFSTRSWTSINTLTWTADL